MKCNGALREAERARGTREETRKPFHIPCLELCTPFNCCKCTVFEIGHPGLQLMKSLPFHIPEACLHRPSEEVPPPPSGSLFQALRLWSVGEKKTHSGKRVLSLSPQSPLVFSLVFPVSPAYDFTRSPTSECRWNRLLTAQRFYLILCVRFSSQASHVRSRVSSRAPHLGKERVTKQ